MAKQNPKSTKEVLFFLVFLILVIFLFIVLEMSLRLIGYGIDTSVFKKVKVDNQWYYKDNSEFVSKYYPIGKNVKTEEKNLFLAKKSKSALRGFIIGGSTAQGYPYGSNMSFGSFLKEAIADTSVYSNVEIINLGYSAMSSYYVADVAKKVSNYEPDFIMIYSGHNEYYGTISQSTSSNHARRKMFLALRESRIFQLVQNLFSSDSSSSLQTETLMEQRFASVTFQKNAGVDDAVTANFISNIDEVVRFYQKRKVPVFVIEPISNIVDMPPFAGFGDADYRDDISKLYATMNSSDKEKLQALHEYFKGSDLCKIANANLSYLYAQIQMMEGKKAYEWFVKAKDEDIIPFRARTNLTEGLKSYVKRYSSEYKNLFYIPLVNHLLGMGDSNLFGNGIFLDHLHFNVEGNRLLALILVQELASYYDWDLNLAMKIFSLQKEAFEMRVGVTQLDNFRVFQSLRTLFEGSPYVDMNQKYKMTPMINDDNQVLKDKWLYQAVRGLIGTNFYCAACEYFLNANMIEELNITLSSLKCLYTGSYMVRYFAYLMLKDYNEPKALQELKMAYYLSGKDRDIYRELKGYD